MSGLGSTAAKTSPAPRPAAAATGASKVVPRPDGPANGIAQAPQLKRKASGPVESSQVKLQRKDSSGRPAQAYGAARPIASPAAVRPNPPAPVSTVPYRGTAAPAGSRTASPVVRKPLLQPSASSPASKAALPAPKSATPPAASSSATSAAPKKGYLALLQKAKEKDASKPITPPVQNGPTKILTKKERLALRAEASAGAKGKKPGRPVDSKADALKDKKKPVVVGYQGTARPSNPPVPVEYRGTARPASAPASISRGGTPAAKSKPKPTKGRTRDGYAEWSDLDEMDDEEGDYPSDASSDMEGDLWDVEEEERIALRDAKKEDAEAMAEEVRLKNEKEARKRRLEQMSKAAATKKRF
jgi:hypothetical protein